MARPKLDTVIDVLPNNDALAEEAQREAEVRSAELALVVRDFGNGIPFSDVVYKDKIRNHLNRSAEELLEASKALYVSYEHICGIRQENYYAWTDFLKDVGLEKRLALRMIQAAKKFCKPETRPLLQAAGNKSKVLELVALDDEEITKVAQGAEDAPITLDEVERMSVSELRKALREARADGEANKKVLEDKNHKLDKLQAELEKAKTPEKLARPQANYDVMALRAELAEEQYNFNVAVKKIGSILENLQESDEDFSTVAQDTLQALINQCQNVAARFGLGLSEANSFDTSWADDETID